MNIPEKEARFTSYLRNRADLLWRDHHKHEFVIALGEGSLPLANFQFYIQQDARYLSEFIKVYAHAILKTDNPEEIEYFSIGIQRILQVEQSLHQKYGKSFGLTPVELITVPMAPTNYAYTRHLLHTAATGTLAELIAAVLPCAWLYADIARFLVGKKAPSTDHPYFDWLIMYASSDFDSVRKWLCDRLDQKAANLSTSEKKRLEEVFLTSMRYELLFWEMAWNKEKWPRGSKNDKSISK